MELRYAIFILVPFLLTGCLKTSSTVVDAGTDPSNIALAECSLNTALTGSCKVTKVGAIVTTTFGSNITSWSNSSGSTSVTGIISNGFYSGKSAVFTDPLLLASNIKSGVTIFGVTGTDPGLASNAPRTVGSSQLSGVAESITYAGQRLPTTGGYVYREIPSITKDDDGTTGGSVTYVNRSTPIDWTTRTCGLSGSIEQRISDCAAQLGSEATWTGSAKGHAGQATWQIVTRTGDCASTGPGRSCREVWRDGRTQLLWSSRVSESINWCKATGSNGIAGNPATEVDPSSYCDNVANQAVAGSAISACYEDGTNFTTTDGTITNNDGKGGLLLTSTPVVMWRLPTLFDYQQANVDGIRYVLPDMGSNATGNVSTYEWTASVLTSARASAWVFDSFLGYVSSHARNDVTINATTIGARCVGR